MKIYKKQAGGVIYTPLNVNMASTQAGTTQTTTSKSSENDQIQKALIDVLKERGLQNDVDYFLRQANRLMTSNTISLFGADEAYDMADLIKLHSLANRIKLNKDSFDKAVENISEENAGSDVAITNTGGLYVQDANGKIKIISAANYHDNSDDYTLLTNRDLLQLRQYQSGLEYNSNILNDLGNTIGMKSIVEYMKSTIKDFGKMEYEDSMDSYTIKHKGQIQKGMENILGGAAPDGIYKVSVTNKSTDQGYEDEKSLFAAAEYLWSTLNGNMKNTIRAHTAAEGLDPTKAKDVYRILISAIQEHTTHSRSRDVDVEYDASASKAAGMDKTARQESLTDEPFGYRVLNDKGNLRPSYLMMDNSKIRNILPTYHYGHIPDKDNNQVPTVTLLSETYRNLQDWGIVDTRRSAYFGSLPITSVAEIGAKILINNADDGANVVYMPIDAVGNIDFGIFVEMMNIQKEIQENRITDETKIKEIWESNGYEYNSELQMGQPINYKLAPYWMQNAYTSTSQDAFNKSDLNQSSIIEKIDRSTIENFSNLYNLDPLHSKNKKIEIQSGIGGTDYKAMIYIPLSSDQGEALFAGGKSYIPKYESDNIHAIAQAHQRTGIFNPSTNQYDHLQTYTSNDLD